MPVEFVSAESEERKSIILVIYYFYSLIHCVVSYTLCYKTLKQKFNHFKIHNYVLIALR